MERERERGESETFSKKNNNFLVSVNLETKRDFGIRSTPTSRCIEFTQTFIIMVLLMFRNV